LSPDEITLVDAAKRLGFEFLTANSTSKNIKIFGTPTRVRVLKYFEFTSDRKRASVIIRDKETGVIKLLIKGADSVIMERLEKSRNGENISLINGHLNNFSNSGLRTLCMAERILSEEEYSELDAKMLDAASKTDREKIIGKRKSLREARRRA
jgi:magnesium-transporting ATPase (P-type)